MGKIADLTIGFLALAVTGVVGTQVYLDHFQPSNNMDNIIAATVQLEDYCSGTIINDPDLSDGEQFTVITAKHCLNTGEGVGTVLTVNVAEDVGNEFTKMTPIETIVKDVSETSDLILLQGIKQDEGLELPKVDIYGGNVDIGDFAISVSYPYGLSKLISSGYLGYIFKIPPFADVSSSMLYQLTTAKVAGGSSGSGLFKESDDGWELIGVLTGGMDFISMYTPLTEVRQFLDEQKKEEVNAA